MKNNWNFLRFSRQAESPITKHKIETGEELINEVLLFLNKEGLEPEQVKINEMCGMGVGHVINIFYFKES